MDNLSIRSSSLRRINEQLDEGDDIEASAGGNEQMELSESPFNSVDQNSPPCNINDENETDKEQTELAESVSNDEEQISSSDQNLLGHLSGENGIKEITESPSNNRSVPSSDQHLILGHLNDKNGKSEVTENLEGSLDNDQIPFSGQDLQNESKKTPSASSKDE